MDLYQYYINIADPEPLLGSDQNDLLFTEISKNFRATGKISDREIKALIQQDLTKLAIEYIINAGERKPRWEDLIAKFDGFLAFEYAVDVLNGPWPQAEKVIASRPDAAYYYARDVLGAPWPPGEPAVAESPSYSLCYARDVLAAPFPQGEPAMKPWPRVWQEYQQLKSGWLNISKSSKNPR